jgi:hypothetical protein
MKVALPDGSIAHIEYVGNVAPKVEVQPVDRQEVAFADPFFADAMMQFVDFARIQAAMDQQMHAMMQMAAQAEHVTASGAPGQVLVSGNLPVGTTVHYTYVSSTNGKNSCTQTVEWRSDGSGQQPQVTRASSGDCAAVKQGEGDKPVQVSAPQPQPAPAKGNVI